MGNKRLKLLDDDVWLESNEIHIQARYDRYLEALEKLNEHVGGLVNHAASHHYLDLQKEGSRVNFREWAPEAQALSLIGDFNDWNPEAHPLSKNEADGIWETSLSLEDLSLGQNYKLRVTGADGQVRDRIPAHATRVVQDKASHDFTAVVDFSISPPPTSFTIPEDTQRNPLIYEE